MKQQNSSPGKVLQDMEVKMKPVMLMVGRVKDSQIEKMRETLVAKTMHDSEVPLIVTNYAACFLIICLLFSVSLLKIVMYNNKSLVQKRGDATS
jgi:hypothetical protein